MKSEIIPYRGFETIAQSYGRIHGSKFFRSVTGSDVLIYLISFFLGRACLIGGLMPFGISMYASIMGITEINRLIVSGCIILGMISAGAWVHLYVTMASMMLFNAFNLPFTKVRKNDSLKYAIIAFAAVLIPELLMVYLQGFLLYDLLKALFNSIVVFATVFVFRNAVKMFYWKKMTAFSSEEIISLVILTAITLTGLSSLSIAGFSIKNTASVLITIATSYACGPGVGAAIGVTVGLIIAISGTGSPLLVGELALCGLFSGLFRRLGKLGASLSFIAGSIILTLYMDGWGEIMPYNKDIILAVGLFTIIPQKFVNLVVGNLYKDPEGYSEKKGYGLRIKEITVDKLQRFSRTFKELSKTLGEVSRTSTIADKQDISVLFDRVADKVCKDCSLCLHCWDRNFYNTYQVMFKIIEKLDSKGRIEERDVPEYFLKRCERIYDFVREVNNIYEIFKVSMIWKNKITECRELVSQQMEGLSRIMENLAAEINKDMHFKTGLEEQILAQLEKLGLKVTEVMAFENKRGKYEVSIYHKGCGGNRKCLSTVEKVVSSVVGRKMTKEESGECYKSQNYGICALKLVEEEVFRVTTGIARLTKHNSDISGDSYTFMNTGDRKYIIALSDGMGTGQKAANQSKATISLIEQFMESGFDKDTTIRLINSILVFKSSEDSYSTIDLAVLDLYSGETEFVKVGAVPTFIKRNDRVEIVRLPSLPAGILINIETELAHKKIENGDFIIMMTDGVVDAFDLQESDETLQEFIRNIRSINPQTIADSIINKVYEKCEGKPMDDMTVAVAKVWKRRD